ncbi:peptidoglycan DD-metalloendopeptidase family protein [Hazenella sp. IB182357]|uniref:Peptidoglycan DD-metalloendopeptidase family protein n=1 Tax=Polycladospora coralii TaxID=2771432 RepID=A0A926N792_9BACL|nr:peptidoglycan DD-metalloendopeptidase family protein [Polycladospora coralii]MBD1371271.1 peptidoglycan DD-metalloendopeptidase family protein [Polycladospora coralii]
MRNPSLLFASALLSLVVIFTPPSNHAWWYMWLKFVNTTDISVKDELLGEKNPSERGKESFSRNNTKIFSVKSFASLDHSGQKTDQSEMYIRLDDAKRYLPIQTLVDSRNGTIQITLNENVFKLTRDIPVYEENGLYAPLTAPPIMAEGDVWLPVSFIEETFGQVLQIKGDTASWHVDLATIPAFSPRLSTEKKSVDEMIEILSVLRTPIDDAHVSTYDSHLPGAARTYRKGVHEGIDWYSYGTGIKIDRFTPIYSMEQGKVIRADHAYQEMTLTERECLLKTSTANNGKTPDYILDKLRGRSVWIQYDNGLMARYAHMDRIEGDLEVGDIVKKGERIGYVGNSGTSDGVKNSARGVHLHLDLFMYGKWFWEDYTFDERKQILKSIF